MREYSIPLVLVSLAVGFTISCGWILQVEPIGPPLTGIQVVSQSDAEQRPPVKQEDLYRAQATTPSSVTASEASGGREGTSLDSLRSHLRQLAGGELSDEEEIALNGVIAREIHELSKASNLNCASVDALLDDSEPTIVREAGAVLLAAMDDPEVLGRLAALASDPSENLSVRSRALVSGARMLPDAQGPASEVFRHALEKMAVPEQNGLVADLAREALAGRL